MRAAQQDNRTYSQKVMLRQTALKLVDGVPVIMETHGGRGDVFSAVYTHVEQGVVFEIDPEKASRLATQRPTWAVYEGDCVTALAHGAGSHLEVNYLDADPYGSCWPTLRAFFSSKRPFAKRLVVVVNDGLRHASRGGSGWAKDDLAQMAERYGNHRLWELYPTRIVRELLEEAIEPAGYNVTFFEEYPTGVELKMVHFLAVLEK